MDHVFVNSNIVKWWKFL